MQIDVTGTLKYLRTTGHSVKINHYRMFTVCGKLQKDCLQKFFLQEHPFAEINPHGGYTTVEVYNADGMLLCKAKYNFGKTQHFNHKIGVSAALGRACKLLKWGGLRKWHYSTL